MKNTSTPLFLLFSVILLVFAGSCNQEKIENRKTLDQLYERMKNGQISECTYNGERTYAVTPLLVHDGGGSILDKNLEVIRSCSYAWSRADSICMVQENCEVIYRAPNQLGLPEIDKYNLRKRNR